LNGKEGMSMADTVISQVWTHDRVYISQDMAYENTPIEGGHEYYYTDLENVNAMAGETFPAWAEFSYTAHGDYVGYADVGAANYRVFKDDYSEHKDIAFISGDYGFQAVIYNTSTKDEEILEILKKIVDYPLIDEDLHSEVTMEWENEAWECWARSDFKRAIAKLFPNLEEIIDDISDEDIWTIFHGAQEKANEYWACETSGAYIDVDKIAKKVTSEGINKFGSFAPCLGSDSVITGLEPCLSKEE
jgi:hypothetical protein